MNHKNNQIGSCVESCQLGFTPSVRVAGYSMHVDAKVNLTHDRQVFFTKQKKEGIVLHATQNAPNTEILQKQTDKKFENALFHFFSNFSATSSIRRQMV